MKPSEVIEHLSTLDDLERVKFLVSLLKAYCEYCGSDDGTYECVCMKDE